MSFFSNLGFSRKTIFGGGLAVGYLAKAISDFNSPKTQGLSKAEQDALKRQNLEEDLRQQRLAEALFRRTRSALGTSSLLYGTYGGTTSLGGASNLGTNKAGAGG